jgi:hypothetical protein
MGGASVHHRTDHHGCGTSFVDQCITPEAARLSWGSPLASWGSHLPRRRCRIIKVPATSRHPGAPHERAQPPRSPSGRSTEVLRCSPHASRPRGRPMPCSKRHTSRWSDHAPFNVSSISWIISTIQDRSGTRRGNRSTSTSPLRSPSLPAMMPGHDRPDRRRCVGYEVIGKELAWTHTTGKREFLNSFRIREPLVLMPTVDWRVGDEQQQSS